MTRMTNKAHNLPKPGFARYRAEYDRATGKFFVIDPDGRRVWGPGAQALAEAKRDALQAEVDTAAKRGPRECLCCGKAFESEGNHNRMCNGCRGRGEVLGAYGYSGAADGRKGRVMAVNACISELRQHGAVIECRQELVNGRRRFFYTMIKGPVS